jgi:hypothetical protein
MKRTMRMTRKKQVPTTTMDTAGDGGEGDISRDLSSIRDDSTRDKTETGADMAAIGRIIKTGGSGEVKRGQMATGEVKTEVKGARGDRGPRGGTGGIKRTMQGMIGINSNSGIDRVGADTIHTRIKVKDSGRGDGGQGGVRGQIGDPTHINGIRKTVPRTEREMVIVSCDANAKKCLVSAVVYNYD